MKFWVTILTFLVSLAPNRALPVEFDCIPLGDFQSTPLECSDPGWPTYDPLWCSCLTSGITDDVGGKAASIEQALIYVYHQRTVGKYLLNVYPGTLKLDKVLLKNRIGSMSINVPYPPSSFLLKFEMEATKVEPNYVEFDVKVTNVNAVAVDVLEYNPLDSTHGNGLTYRGYVRSFGSNLGFELFFEYLDPPLPPATETGIEDHDLEVLDFSIQALLTFPSGNASFYLPQESLLQVTTVMDQIRTNPDNPVQRIFEESFDISVSTVKFRRGDSSPDNAVNLTDVISQLQYLFADGAQPACMDAADANDDGKVDLSDPIKLIFNIFMSQSLPYPGAILCGADGNDTDTLPPCSYNC